MSSGRGLSLLDMSFGSNGKKHSFVIHRNITYLCPTLINQEMKVNNKDVIQSYIVTTAKYDFNVYEKRILYRIIEMLQEGIHGLSLNKKYEMKETRLGDLDITLPVGYFLKDEKDRNHARIKKALVSLESKVFEYEDAETWQRIRLIERPEIGKISETVTLRLHPKIYEALLDFSKGFKKYELKIAMEFDTVYAMRFYELFSSQKSPITFTIEKLKEMFSVTDKYKLNADFIRFVVAAGKKELDIKAPYSFMYEVIKHSNKIVAIKFSPYLIPENRDLLLEEKALKAKVNISWTLEKIIIDYLKHSFEFTTKEIKNNLELFEMAQKKIDLLLTLSELRSKCRDKDNPKGYVISSLKKMLQKINK